MQKNQLYILNFYKLYIEPTHFNSKIIILAERINHINRKIEKEKQTKLQSKLI